MSLTLHPANPQLLIMPRKAKTLPPLTDAERARQIAEFEAVFYFTSNQNNEKTNDRAESGLHPDTKRDVQSGSGS